MKIRVELIALILLIVALAGLLFASHREDIGSATDRPDQVQRSSYRSIAEGYLAPYLTLRELGYPVRRLTRPYKLLPEQGGLLIVADPGMKPFGPYEARVLREWLARGNHALFLVEHNTYAFDHLSDDPPKDPPGIPVPFVEHENTWMKDVSLGSVGFPPRPVPLATTDTPVAPSFLSARAPALAIRSSYRMKGDALIPTEVMAYLAPAVPLYRSKDGVSVAYSAVGKGGIVWSCSPWSWSNDGIAEAGNLDFLLALADLKPGAPVIFDEYHQGYGADMSVWTLLPRIAKMGVLQLAAGVLLLLMLLGWRFGVARAPAEERFTRSRGEYLTSMAALLARARATHVVRERLATLLRREVGRRLGIPPHAPLERFVQANAQTQYPVVDHHGLERVVRQLTAMEGQARPDAAALFRLAGEVHRLLHRKH